MLRTSVASKDEKVGLRLVMMTSISLKTRNFYTYSQVVDLGLFNT
jgi:hypothetical protein